MQSTSFSVKVAAKTPWQFYPIRRSFALVYLWFIFLILAAALLLLVIWAAWRKRPQLPALVVAAAVAWTALTVITMFMFARFIPLNYGLAVLLLTLLVTMLGLLQWGWSRTTAAGALVVFALAAAGGIAFWAQHDVHPQAVNVRALYQPATLHRFGDRLDAEPALPLPPKTVLSARTSTSHALYWTTTDLPALADFYQAIADDGRVEREPGESPVRYKLTFTYHGRGIAVTVHDWPDPRVIRFGVDLASPGAT